MSIIEMVVRLTLPKASAEKLRAICHRRGKLASEIIDEWICKADETGTIGAQEQRMRDFAGHFADALRNQRKTP